MQILHTYFQRRNYYWGYQGICLTQKILPSSVSCTSQNYNNSLRQLSILRPRLVSVMSMSIDQLKRPALARAYADKVIRWTTWHDLIVTYMHQGSLKCFCLVFRDYLLRIESFSRDLYLAFSYSQWPLWLWWTGQWLASPGRPTFACGLGYWVKNQCSFQTSIHQTLVTGECLLGDFFNSLLAEVGLKK